MAEQAHSRNRTEIANRLRFGLPLLTLAIGILIWDLVVRVNEHSALHAAGPLLRCSEC